MSKSFSRKMNRKLKETDLFGQISLISPADLLVVFRVFEDLPSSIIAISANMMSPMSFACGLLS